MNKIYAIVKHPGEEVGHIMEIENTLEALQEAVGGHVGALPIAKNLFILCDEEGLYNDKPYNTHVNGIGFLGTILAVGVEGDEFADVPIGLDDWEDMIDGKPEPKV